MALSLAPVEEGAAEKASAVAAAAGAAEMEERIRQQMQAAAQQAQAAALQAQASAAARPHTTSLPFSDKMPAVTSVCAVVRGLTRRPQTVSS
jgi:hypothetical protein